MGAGVTYGDHTRILVLHDRLGAEQQLAIGRVGAVTVELAVVRRGDGADDTALGQIDFAGAATAFLEYADAFRIEWVGDDHGAAEIHRYLCQGQGRFVLVDHAQVEAFGAVGWTHMLPGAQDQAQSRIWRLGDRHRLAAKAGLTGAMVEDGSGAH